MLKEVVEYIDIQFAKKGAWPENVLIRDYLYKIIEYSVNRRGFPDSMLITYQPPYKSEKLTKVSEETLQKWKMAGYILTALRATLQYTQFRPRLKIMDFQRRRLAGS